MTCDTCRKKKTCVELCEEAEEYVNQDTVYEQSESKAFKFSNESTLNMDSLDDIEERKTQELIFYFQKINSMRNTSKKAILSLVYFGFPLRDIANILKTNFSGIQRAIKNNK
jgi:DNA-directed RNA polymerase specialized sigma24 family protein